LPLDSACDIENVSLEDVIQVLQVVTGMSQHTITLQADVDGDGKLGVADAISIFIYVAGMHSSWPIQL
jgi:hypothetical protein